MIQKDWTGVNFYLFPASNYNIVDVNMVKLVRKSFLNTGIMTILFIIIAEFGIQNIARIANAVQVTL